MHGTIICWVFISSFFASSNSYVISNRANTDDGYCEYYNGILIPVNDHAFDGEKCETIECKPGEIVRRGCGVSFPPLYPGLNCTLIRGTGFRDCCPSVPKCKVIYKFPGNNSYPKDWIIEDDGTAFILKITNFTYEDDGLEEYATEEDMGEENTTEKDTTAEGPTPEDPTVEDTTVEHTTAEDTTAEDTTSEDTTKEDTTTEDTTAIDTTAEDTTKEDTTVDPLLSAINRQARNHPISYRESQNYCTQGQDEVK